MERIGQGNASGLPYYAAWEQATEFRREFLEHVRNEVAIEGGARAAGFGFLLPLSYTDELADLGITVRQVRRRGIPNAARGGAIFIGNFKLGLPAGSAARKATLQRISSLKGDFAASNGTIVRQLNKAPVDSNGKRIFGIYDSKSNTITLYKDTDLSTLTHELLHFEQAKIGNRIGKNLIDTPAQRAIIERDILWKLQQLGFVPRTP